MADYCSLTDALSLLPAIGTPDASSKPSAMQCAALLGQTTAEIAMHLRARGIATVNDPEAVASLRAIAMNGAAARIAKAKWPAVSGPGAAPSAAEVLREDYLAGLSFIDGGGLGPDTETDSASGALAHGFVDSEGVSLTSSTLVGRVTRETEF